MECNHGWQTIMLVSVKEKIKKYILSSRKREYLWKCLINRDNNEFVSQVLDWAESPYNIQICHYGNQNSGKIIYVITEEGCDWGFFAEFRAMLVKLLYADRLGMIPVVIYGNKFLYYEKEGINGEDNAFQYYFSQDMHKEDVYDSANVVWSNLRHSQFIEIEYCNNGYVVSKEFINDLAFMMKKYINFNDQTLSFLKRCSNELLKDRKILGVHYRGTDFKKGYYKHPIIVEVDQIVEEVKRCCNENGYEAVFLATDDQGALETFQKLLGNQVLYYKDVFRGDQDVSVAFSESQRKHHKYLLGLEVIRDVYTLSICSGLICGLSQIGMMAQVMKKSYGEEYENLTVINNGVSDSAFRFN